MTLSAKELFNGYINGIFPMADPDGTIYWYAPQMRAVIPIYQFKPSKSLRPVINQKRFEVKVNANFEATMRNCAKPRSDTDETWISDEIIAAYTDLHQRGLAHSVETYQNGKLVGGLYGVSIGGAFFGESMFHAVSNASKVAFFYLIENLKHQKFQLLDSQFMNDNVERYGAYEIPKDAYEAELAKAIRLKVGFTPGFGAFDIEELLGS